MYAITEDDIIFVINDNIEIKKKNFLPNFRFYDSDNLNRYFRDINLEILLTLGKEKFLSKRLYYIEYNLSGRLECRDMDNNEIPITSDMYSFINNFSQPVWKPTIRSVLDYDWELNVRDYLDDEEE